MKKRSTILIIIIVVLIIGLISLIFLDKDMMKKIDNYSYNIFKVHILSNKDTKINREEIIKTAKNKDYKDSVIFPYYELLSKKEKTVYDELLDAVNDYKKTLRPSEEISPEALNDVYNALMYDHPELFWLSTDYSCMCDETNQVIKIDLEYTNIMSKIKIARIKFDEEINKIAVEANKLKTDYEKELYVHDTLINKIKYTTDEKNDQSAYGAVVLGKSVCVGYAKAFQFIMNKLGIPTYYIVGLTNENHAWNLIELEDGFYNVDLTLDDGEDEIYYTYFNVNDEMINKDHMRKGLSQKLIDANGNKYINSYSKLK